MGSGWAKILVFTAVLNDFVQNVQFQNMFGPFLHKMFGFTACLANFLLKMLVLQHVWHDFCPKSWFYSMFGEFSGRGAGLGSGRGAMKLPRVIF